MSPGSGDRAQPWHLDLPSTHSLDGTAAAFEAYGGSMRARRSKLTSSILLAVAILIPAIVACEMRRTDRMEMTEQKEKMVLFSAPFSEKTRITAKVFSEGNSPNKYYAIIEWEPGLPKKGRLHRHRVGVPGNLWSQDDLEEGVTSYRDVHVSPGESYQYQVSSDSMSTELATVVIPKDLEIVSEMQIPQKGHYSRIFFRKNIVISTSEFIQWDADLLEVEDGAGFRLIANPPSPDHPYPPSVLLRVRHGTGILHVSAERPNGARADPEEAIFYLSSRSGDLDVRGHSRLISKCTSVKGVLGRDWNGQCDSIGEKFDELLAHPLSRIPVDR